MDDQRGGWPASEFEDFLPALQDPSRRGASVRLAFAFFPDEIERCRNTSIARDHYVAARLAVWLGLHARQARDEDLGNDYTQEDRAGFEAYYDQGIAELVEMSRSGSYAAATWTLVKTYVYEGKLESAVEVSRERASAGDPVGQFALGYLHWNGLGVQQDTARAVELITASSAAGYAQAQFNLGWMYDQGHGVPRNDDRAVLLYEAALRGFHPLAAFNLGLRARDGVGQPQDLERAFELFEFAAMGSVASATAEVGWAYLNGRGTEVNLPLAARWLGRASGSNPMATIHWALLVSNGQHDNPAWHFDPAKARQEVLTRLARVDQMTTDEGVRELAREVSREIESSPLPRARRDPTPDWWPRPRARTESIVAGLALGALLVLAMDLGSDSGGDNSDYFVPSWQDPSNPAYYEMSYLSGGASLCC